MTEQRDSDYPGKYWICSDCAALKDWTLPNPNGITCTEGKCSWCESGKMEMLVPVCDFSGPKGKRAIWD